MKGRCSKAYRGVPTPFSSVDFLIPHNLLYPKLHLLKTAFLLKNCGQLVSWWWVGTGSITYYIRGWVSWHLKTNTIGHLWTMDFTKVLFSLSWNICNASELALHFPSLFVVKYLFSLGHMKILSHGDDKGFYILQTASFKNQQPGNFQYIPLP